VKPACSAAVMTAVAAVAAGCGLGPGETSEGTATLTVTSDYGAEPVLEASESDPAESETVIRFLDREAEITTRYGGGFVQSIEGTSGAYADGRSRDWFFFVNGIESPRGSAEVPVRGGDRIWWDYRDWTDAISTPAVVGSWPEPFLQAAAEPDEREPVEVDCRGVASACEEVRTSLRQAGVDVGEADHGGPRLLVGAWARLRADPIAARLDDGPATSGVFARFERSGSGWELEALDQRARPSRSFAGGAGIVAGLRRGDDPVTWLVTGTDARGVGRAARLLDADALAHHYAVVTDGASIPVPDGGAE
jgi:Domain of unknown function (DUF4430)